MNLRDTLVRDPAAIVRAAGEGWWTLADPDAGCSIALNETAVAAWRHIDGRRTAKEVVEAVLLEYDAPLEAAASVVAVLERLEDEGFLASGLPDGAGSGEEAEPRFVRLGPGRLRSVEVAVTARCNARCRYCYYFDNPDVRYEDLPAAEWVTFFAELGRLGVADVCVAGGEPFLRPDLRTILDGAVSAGLRFQVLSNGALLDDEMAAYLAGTGRCDHVQISVDGSRPGTHDAARGAGSFEGAVRALGILERHGVTRMVRVTVHKHNVDDLEATAELLLDGLGVPVIGTNAAGYLGSCTLNGDGLQLTTEERERAMRTLVALAERYPGRVLAAAGPLMDARMWERMEAARRESAPPFANGGRLTACGCAWSKLAVQADGSIVICPLLPQPVLGRVNEDDVGEIWRSDARLWRHRGRREIPLDRFAHCEDCPYVPYCTGNCPGLAASLTGMVDHPAPDACLRDYLASGGALVEAPDGS